MADRNTDSGPRFRASTFADINGVERAPVRKVDERDFNEEAEALRRRIEREVLDRARGRAAAIERDTYEKGFKKGEEAGQKVILHQLAPFLRNFESLTKELTNLRALHLEALREELMGLAVEIARRVVHAELELAPERIGEIARAAIQSTVDRERLVLRVSQTDRDFLEQFRPELLTIEGVKQITIEADPRVEGGGCIVETKSGEVDATIPTQLRQFECIEEPAQ